MGRYKRMLPYMPQVYATRFQLTPWESPSKTRFVERRTGVPTGHPPALYADDDGQRSLRWEFVRLRHVLSRAGTVLGFPVGEPSVEFHTLEVAHNHGVLGDGIWFPISG